MFSINFSERRIEYTSSFPRELISSSTISDYISSLPPELISIILSQTDYSTTASLSMTCKGFRVV